MPCCKNCNYARKALAANSHNLAHQGLIACAYWSTYTEYEEIQGPDRVYEAKRPPKWEMAIQKKLTDNTVFEGWADLKARPNTKGSGITTNYCIILHSTGCCKMYSDKEER